MGLIEEKSVFRGFRQVDIMLKHQDKLFRHRKLFSHKATPTALIKGKVPLQNVSDINAKKIMSKIYFILSQDKKI